MLGWPNAYLMRNCPIGVFVRVDVYFSAYPVRILMPNQDTTSSLPQTRITLRQIAQNLNLSHTTVSRVLNSTEGVFISEATRLRVSEEAKRLGYQPNHAARALITGKTNIVGFAIGTYTSTYNVRAMELIDRHLLTHGKRMMVQSLIGFDNSAPSDSLFQWPLDGLIILDFPDHVLEIVRLAPPGMPIISMGAYSADLTDHVTLDLFGGATEAMAWLTAQQCDRIIFVTTEYEARVGEPRYDAYRTCMQKHQRPLERVLAKTPVRYDAYQAFSHYLENGLLSHNEKIGIFCLDDEFAIACHRALREKKFDIDNKIRIIGCDDTDNLPYIDQKIGSVAYKFEDVCKSAVSMMLNRIKNPQIPRQEDTIGSYLRTGIFDAR
jgi:DNA-binding LacI/PurR family transcriptional regulator